MSDSSRETGIVDPKKEASSWKKHCTVKKLLLLLLIIALVASLTWLIIFLAIGNDLNTDQESESGAPSNLRKPFIDDLLSSDERVNDDVVDSCNEICNSSSCYEKANYYLANMNLEINPCDDFYQFACGNYVKNTPVPDDENKVDQIRTVKKKIYSELISELEKESSPEDPEAFKKTRKFYQNCMNEQLIEERSKEIFLGIISDAGGWPVLLGDSWQPENFSWVETVLKLYDYGYPTALPGPIRVMNDPKNSTRRFISVSNAETRISPYFVTEGPNNRVLKAYYRYMVDLVAMLGASKYNAVNEMTECLKFELDLYHIKSSIEDLSNTSRIYNPMTIAELSERHRSVPWLDFFKRVFEPSGVVLGPDDTVNLVDPAYLRRLENLIARTPKRVLANYLFWQAAYNSVDYLPDAYLDRKLDFKKVSDGVKERKPRSHACLDEVMVVFEVSLSVLYARNYFDAPDVRKNAIDLVRSIKNEFQEMLFEADWMDDETREAAKDKLEAMDVFVAYSDEFFVNEKLDEYYKDLEINTDDYLLGSVNASRFYLHRYLGNLRKPANDKDWTSHGNTAVVNAYYITQRNSMELPAGILQRPFFEPYVPNYLNYGAIGSIIGHEMTHGFDSEGRKNDKDGNQVDWWQTSTKQEYLERAQCFVDQYSGYTVEDAGLKLNGKLTLGENIADNGGFKVAYRAYSELTRRNGRAEPCLPLMSYTPRQMFWISAANVWCARLKPEALKAAVLGDFHSPPGARVTLSFSNSREFSSDFGCEVGARMNPEDKCAVW